ncbi:twin-arginine translocase TatA/TatE family subunit [Streptomyces sp. MA5143a]|uniref:twin-arginine translocase TatA/TatE family subunit n=1 Tax=Streptomyces sp. MA5143a TaxID=2083010 RepID=UPI000D29B098|nr:twin-arginine translocase TatA/TatE family subunit [Streptomyces sp. MA5143a]SPF06707.1 twin arginine translocase protein A [Streptomyces sp. MA5143a]
MFGLSELALILLVVVVVLGIKKLPELARSAGKAARIFKSEARALKEQGPSVAPPPRPVEGTVQHGDEGSPRA